jgi:glycosyltransferase involved in cell wall biosynthesis
MGVYKEPLDWLRQSIDSILNQSFTDYEFIIICDNPRYEEGMELLKKYANSDRRIILLFNNENIGLTKSLNKGLEIARGKYIARMDADDISKPERLTRQKLSFWELGLKLLVKLLYGLNPTSM